MGTASLDGITNTMGVDDNRSRLEQLHLGMKEKISYVSKQGSRSEICMGEMKHGDSIRASRWKYATLQSGLVSYPSQWLPWTPLTPILDDTLVIFISIFNILVSLSCGNVSNDCVTILGLLG